MTRNQGLKVSLFSIFVGFVLNALAWTVLPGPTFSTFGLLVGVGLMIYGAIQLLVSINKNSWKRKNWWIKFISNLERTFKIYTNIASITLLIRTFKNKLDFISRVKM